MKVIKAKEQLADCFGCIFKHYQCEDSLLALIEAGLPDCNEGYIYIIEEVKDENIS